MWRHGYVKIFNQLIFNTSYPYLLITLMLMLSGVLSYWLYVSNPIRFKQKWKTTAIALLRFTTLFILLFLLLEPMLSIKSKSVEKPIILIAADNSKSVILNKDSLYFKKEFPNQLTELTERLSKEYQVEMITFGSDIRNDNKLTFTESETNISKVFEKAENDFANLNLGAVILATDGVFNTGENPEYIADKLNVQVFTIGLGDTNFYKDVIIKNVRYSDVVFEGNSFIVAADILLKKVNNKNIQTWIEHNGKNIASNTINRLPGEDFATLTFTIPAVKEGVQTYTLKAEELDGEISYLNNSYTFQVNVLKSRQKVFIAANVPHPDLGALKQALESNVNISAEVLFTYAADAMSKIKQADMVIFHLIPDLKNQGLSLLQNAIQNNIPMMLILGPNSNFQSLAQLFQGLSVSSNPSYNNMAQAYLQPDFNLFGIDEKQYEFFAKLPPLYAPYGSYKLPADAQILFNQQIGYTKTANPLLFFIKAENNYTGFLLGEGFWRWRMHDYLLNNNQNLTNDLINKCVQLIAVKNDKSKFRVKPIKKTFYVTDNVEFEANLYNEANELTNKPDASITIIHENGKKYQYAFSKVNNFYVLNVGELPEGKYTFEANALQHKKEGSFFVLPQQSEYINTTANFNLLNNIAAKTNGKFYLPRDIKNIADDIKKAAVLNPLYTILSK